MDTVERSIAAHRYRDATEAFVDACEEKAAAANVCAGTVPDARPARAA